MHRCAEVGIRVMSAGSLVTPAQAVLRVVLGDGRHVQPG